MHKKEECKCGKNCDLVIKKSRSVGLSTLMLDNLEYKCDIVGFDREITKEILDKVNLLIVKDMETTQGAIE